MFNKKIIFRVLGSLLLIEAALLAVCVLVGLAYHENVLGTFGLPIGASLALALLLKGLGHGADNTMSRRDGYLTVTLSWVIFSIVGAIPILLGGHEPRFSAVFFESMSGFTTTGATVLNGIDALPRSLLVWRSLMHWFGGLGIVFFTLAILPSMGSGGDLKLFSAEATGLKMDKLHPRIGTTARWLWGVYLFLTVACATAYYLGGMSFFDAVNHAFSTIATGGFSTHQASFAYFNSPLLEVTASIFMLLSGINFTLVYLLIIKGRYGSVWRDSELRCFIAIIVTAVLAITVMLVASGRHPWLEALRLSFFNVISLQSSTGLTSNDIALWPQETWVILILITAIGSCAGSTAGGIKCVRILTCIKIFIGEFRRALHPAAVLPVRLNGVAIAPGVFRSVFAFLVAYVVILLSSAFILLLMGLPLLDAFGITVTLLSNAGPTFGHQFTPLDTFSALPDGALWLGSFLMLAGRLEIFSVLLPLAPSFWHDN